MKGVVSEDALNTIRDACVQQVLRIIYFRSAANRTALCVLLSILLLLMSCIGSVGILMNRKDKIRRAEATIEGSAKTPPSSQANRSRFLYSCKIENIFLEQCRMWCCCLRVVDQPWRRAGRNGFLHHSSIYYQLLVFPSSICCLVPGYNILL
jgi:hypothetical protein